MDTLRTGSDELVILTLCDELISAADVLLSVPDRRPAVYRSLKPGSRVKTVNRQSVNWLKNHPRQLRCENGRLKAIVSPEVIRAFSYDTPENRLLKFVLKSAELELQSLCRNVGNDKEFSRKIQRVSRGLIKRSQADILKRVSETVSLGKAPADPKYRRLYIDHLALSQAVSDYISALNSAPQEKGITEFPPLLPYLEERLKGANWSERNVLIGALSSRHQLDVCLYGNFYHIPASQVEESELPVEYVAIYQSRSLFGDFGGVRYYGKVAKTSRVPRNKIKEIPSDKKELYYRFQVEDWSTLPKPITPKEVGFVHMKTNEFLLHNAVEVPELFLTSEKDYRFYQSLKTSVEDVTFYSGKQSFIVDGYVVAMSEGKITLSKNDKVLSVYEMTEFSHSPTMILRSLQRDISL